MNNEVIRSIRNDLVKVLARVHLLMEKEQSKTVVRKRRKIVALIEQADTMLAGFEGYIDDRWNIASKP